MSNTTKPTIEVITERPLFPAGQEQTADLLIRITPPKVEAQTKRHRLNLSLVLDRSGSMEGEKIARAREAAAFCIDQLLAEDRISLVIFDDVVEVLAASQPAENKGRLKSASRTSARETQPLCTKRGCAEESKS